jgi:hypothetical protein
VADKIGDRYLCEASEDLRQRVDRHEALRALAKVHQFETARLVRILRSEGDLPPDLATGQILKANARAGGVSPWWHDCRHPCLPALRGCV